MGLSACGPPKSPNQIKETPCDPKGALEAILEKPWAAIVLLLDARGRSRPSLWCSWTKLYKHNFRGGNQATHECLRYLQGRASTLDLFNSIATRIPPDAGKKLCLFFSFCAESTSDIWLANVLTIRMSHATENWRVNVCKAKNTCLGFLKKEPDMQSHIASD